MTKREAIDTLELNRPFVCNDFQKAIDMAINAIEKQIELSTNCEGSCIDCKYRGEFHCANDLLIDSEV